MVCRGGAGSEAPDQTVRTVRRSHRRNEAEMATGNPDWAPSSFETGQGCRGRVSCRKHRSSRLRRLFGQEKISCGDAEGAEAAESTEKAENFTQRRNGDAKTQRKKCWRESRDESL
jgi:hypothetical protein